MKKFADAFEKIQKEKMCGASFFFYNFCPSSLRNRGVNILLSAFIIMIFICGILMFVNNWWFRGYSKWHLVWQTKRLFNLLQTLFADIFVGNVFVWFFGNEESGFLNGGDYVELMDVLIGLFDGALARWVVFTQVFLNKEPFSNFSL